MKRDTLVPKTPQNLESAILVVRVKTWIAVASILVLLGALLIWAYFGTMYINVDVSGVLVRSGKVVTIYSPEDSIVLDLSVRAGQYVEKNQVVARLDQSDLVNEINRMMINHEPEEAISLAREELLDRSRVITYDAGRVIDVYVHTGDYVQKGTKLATVLVNASSFQSMECLLFVPMQQARSIRKGMPVNVYPDFADKQEYGNMKGTVAQISEYPITRPYLYDILGNEDLVEAFLGGSAYYEVTVNLERDDTRTGYKWTIRDGPEMDIGDLALCDATIITASLKPIDVFFSGD